MTNAKKALIYVEMKINDPAGFKNYTALSAPAVRAAGGRYLVAGGRPELLEGELRGDRVVVVEFDSVEAARRFYHSAEYKRAREKRQGGVAEFTMVLLETAA